MKPTFFHTASSYLCQQPLDQLGQHPAPDNNQNKNEWIEKYFKMKEILPKRGIHAEIQALLASSGASYPWSHSLREIVR